MLLNVSVLLLILMVTAYLSTQGMLSALLALATSIFSSILAMALLEPLQGIIGGWRPDYARGVTFLLLFFLVFSITRIVADTCVPKNIKLSLLVNRVTGGVIGFFVGLVVVGTLLIGLEMLPVNRTPLGFERFPDGNYMQAMDGDKPVLGEVAKPANVWFAPDRFVLTIWSGTSGRSLGGAHSFASIHPDLSIESYGYRNQINGSLRTLPANLLTVTEAWKSTERSYKDKIGTQYPKEGNALVMVRTQIGRGDQPPKVSTDEADNRVRIAATQVRLITQQGHQFYPIGYLEQGRVFMPMTLDTGYLVDDFEKLDHVVEDWIFQVPVEETPQYVEVKQLARQELAVKDKPTPALAAGEYPPHKYLQDLGSLSVVFDPGNSRDLKVAHVIILRSRNKLGDLSTSEIRKAYNHVIECDKAMQASSGGWKDAGGPAVPDRYVLQAAENIGQHVENDPPDSGINWGGMLPLLLCGQVSSDGARNLIDVPRYFDGDFMNLLKNAPVGSLILASADADSNGKAVLGQLEKAKYTVIFSELLTKDGQPRAFLVWVKELDLNTTSQQRISDSTADSPSFSLDLDSKKP